ncbi:MAG: polysaccharide biosynthesis/export family protein [Thermoanaerobaculia bacterium]
MRLIFTLSISALLTGGASVGAAQAPRAIGQTVSSGSGAAATPVIPAGYVIGPSDVLSIVFWRDKDMTAEVTVRPDGKITLPLLNEVVAGGYTPEELRVRLVEAAKKFIEDPNATVVVKEIRSRNVFITGNVAKPASYPLTNDMTALQLIALAGGLFEYADASSIVIIRTEGAHTQYLKFNYKDVIKQKNVGQNVTLKPGDTVVVP